MKAKIITAVIVVLLIAVPVALYMRPLPNQTVALSVPEKSVVPGALSLPLPSTGESGVAVQGVGIMSDTSNETQIPIGSVAKVMTAYLVLQHHPLQPYQSGPSYTITQTDVAKYVHDKAIGDSYVKVVAGQKWTEKQMLEGLLLPSGDNMAYTLGVWTDGSEQAFVNEMNQTAKKLGMTHTTYADSSGVSPNTASTAVDELKLARVAMQNPVFRTIVDMAQATLPGGSQPVYNVDYYVGHYGIVGIKTGSTPQAGGCFVSATYDKVGNQQVLLLGAVLGQQGTPMLDTALNNSRSLLQDAKKDVTVSSVPQGTVVADINVPWQGKVALETSQPISYLSFPGLPITRQLVVTKTKSGTNYALEFQAGEQRRTVPLQQSEAIVKPSLKWRILRGMKLPSKL
jgi:serine-type D-Ala-D-Ala carboxypeptidase (penicillin-binding protein 5/6)